MASPLLYVTSEEVNAALRSLLLEFVPQGVEVVRGQTNRVPMPGSDIFIVFNETSRHRLAMNVDTYDRDLGRLIISKSTEVGYQLDIYGRGGSDIAQVITTLWRSELGCSLVDADVFQPLYATDGQQMPLVDGEKQYQDRWTQTAYLQVTPRVSTPTDFADSVTVALVEIS